MRDHVSTGNLTYILHSTYYHEYSCPCFSSEDNVIIRLRGLYRAGGDSVEQAELEQGCHRVVAVGTVAHCMETIESQHFSFYLI